MAPSILEQFLVSELFAFLLIFCRIGAGIMILPGFGEAYVSPRVRLIFALMLSLLLTPAVGDLMPPVPGAPLSLFMVILAEVMVGLFIGTIARMIVSALHIAGSIIASQASLSMAMMFDLTQGGQSTVVGNFLTLTAVVLFFALNIHHLMIEGLMDSYTLFSPGMFPVVEDMAAMATDTMGRAFLVAVQISAPHIVFALMFYLGAGVLSRLMPTMQVFFILMPPQMVGAFFLLLAVFSAMMFHYTDFVEEALRGFLEH